MSMCHMCQYRGYDNEDKALVEMAKEVLKREKLKNREEKRKIKDKRRQKKGFTVLEATGLLMLFAIPVAILQKILIAIATTQLDVWLNNIVK